MGFALFQKVVARTQEPFAPPTAKLPGLFTMLPSQEIQPTLQLPTVRQIVDRAGPSFVPPPTKQERLIPSAATDYDNIRNDVDRSGDGFIEVYNRPVRGGAALMALPEDAEGQPVQAISSDKSVTSPAAPPSSTFAVFVVAVLGFMLIRRLA